MALYCRATPDRATEGVIYDGMQVSAWTRTARAECGLGTACADVMGMRLGWTELDCLGLNIPALDRLFGALGGATFVYNSILPESNIELISSRVCRPAGAFSPNFLVFFPAFSASEQF